MITFAHWVLRHRSWISGFWIVMLVAGAFAAPRVADRVDFDFSMPDQAGYETHQELLATYGNGGTVPPLLIVLTVPDDTTVEAEEDAVATLFAGLAEEFPHFRFTDWTGTRDPVFLTDDGRTTFALVHVQMAPLVEVAPADQLAPAVKAIDETSGFEVRLTGYDALGGSNDVGGLDDSALTETLLAALAALTVLLFVFASFLALVPVMVAAVSVLSTFLLVLGLTYFTDVSFFVQFLIGLLGLGLAIDYSLLIVTRWREERDHGRSNEEAVVESVTHAGRAVLASGLTVGISLIALVVLPIPVIRSAGIGGMLIPLVSCAVALTLLPALLAARFRGREVGARIDWPRLRHEDHESRPWRAWASGVVRFRWLAAGAGLAALAVLTVPLIGIKIGVAQTDALSGGGSASQALETLHDGGVPEGVVLPMEVLVEGGDPAAVVAAAREVDGVSAAFAPPAWQRDGRTVVEVIPDAETTDLGQIAVVEDLTEALEPVPGVVGVTGHGAEVLDYDNAVFSIAPWIFLGIAFLTFLLLVRTFRSVVLPLKAIAMNIVSVAAALGAVVAFWQWGWGSEAVYGIDATGAVTFWVPVVIFAFLFGLSMDYEVFLLSRIREEYDVTGDTDTAVVRGLARTGRLITGAALILFCAFAALATTDDTNIKLVGTALGIGILLDATIVRALLVPALVSLFGRWNWWLPDWLARALLVRDHRGDGRTREPHAVPVPDLVGEESR